MTAPRDFVSTYEMDAAVITVISEGTLPWMPRYQVSEEEWRRVLPDADGGGRIVLGCNIAHLRVGGASIMVDPGFHGPSSAWQQTFAARYPGFHRSPGMVAGLARIGVSPDEITHVLVTHAHEDHFAGVVAEQDGRLLPRFPRARHLLGRADWEGNPGREDASSALAVRLGTIGHLGLLDLVDGEREVTPGVTMLPAPGESPGHCVVRVQAGGERFYFLGDLVHHACEVEHADWVPGQNRDRVGILASRARLFAAIAAEGALAVFSHAPFPGWGRIVPSANGYRWEALD